MSLMAYMFIATAFKYWLIFCGCLNLTDTAALQHVSETCKLYQFVICKLSLYLLHDCDLKAR